MRHNIYITKCFYLLFLIISTTGCGKHFKRAKLPPVKEGWQQPTAAKNAYVVQKKDTMYSIAWAFGLDYRALAKKNNLNPPYILRIGQRLHIGSVDPIEGKFSSKPLSIIHGKWGWPAAGSLVAGFDTKLGGNKGIDIKGKYNDPVLTSNSGKVVYTGTGIRSYGKLIIIKHNDDYLSAYAHNKSILVHEGQTVAMGQKIATMGTDDMGNVCLHFEIRRIGKPVNPLLYLPKKL